MGLVLGFMAVAFMFSFASLVFAEAPVSFLGAGAALMLAAAAAHNLVSARWSRMMGAIIIPQDASTAVVAASLVGVLPAVASTQRLGAILLYSAVCTLAAGAVMFLLGAFRLGGLVRFVPLPVIGGFLAGTGWLLVSGGAELVTAGYLLDPLHLTALAGTALFGVGLLLLLRRRPNVIVFPVVVGGAVATFFALLGVTGTPLAEARTLGFLPDVAEAAFRLPWAEVVDADGSVLTRGLGGVITVPLVATMALLLNVSALDILRGEDTDLDHELRAVGLANLFTAVGAAPAGYHGLGPTALAFRLGVASPVVPAVVAGVCLLVASVGSRLVGLVPIPVVAGLLVFLGLGFMTDWLIDRRRQMTRPEFAVMLSIVVVVATLGLLAAVGWGMVAAVILFVITYSRIDPIRSVGTGKERRSTVDRPPAAAGVLDEAGEEVLVVELQGYLFFGTSHALVDRIHAMMSRPPRALIIDLHRVQGADSTALSTFAKLARLSGDMACRLILSDVPDRLQAGLDGAIEHPDRLVVPDLDHALEAAEDRILAGVRGGEASCRDVFGSTLWARLEPHLERQEVDAGEVIIHHGDDEIGLLAIERGEVVTEIPVGGGWRRVRSSGPGTVVGEMSIYRQGTRSARVRTVVPTILYRLTEAAVTRLERSEPETAAELHRTLARLLADRVALGNEAIRSLLD